MYHYEFMNCVEEEKFILSIEGRLFRMHLGHVLKKGAIYYRYKILDSRVN